MRLNSNELSNAVRFALAFGVVSTASMVATAAHAQTAKTGEKAESLETITVVGSRIKRTDVETSQPVFVLERAELQKTGLTSIGDILQHLSSSGGAALNTVVNNGGDGSTQIDLRNLGPNRVLVLVNGRRWTVDDFGQTDLNTIPVSIIERVEVLKDGASAVYGSDAIAGVINITTRDKYNGAEASAYWGQNQHGDGEQQLYDFTIGSSSEKASVVMNVSYAQQDPVFAGDRHISECPTVNLGCNDVNAGASSTTPYGRFREPGVPGTVTLIPGRPGTSPSDFRPFNLSTDGYNFAPANYLATPQQRTGLYVQGRYNITDNISFKSEVMFNRRESNQQLATVPLTLGTTTIFGGPFTQINVSSANIYNPFGANVTRAQRRLVETGPRIFSETVDTYHFGGGFEGNFDVWGHNWTWDMNYTFNKNFETDTNTNLVNLAAVANAVGPSFIDAAGAHCGTAGHVIIGCVPLNLFGGPGSITPDMVDYISYAGVGKDVNKRYNYSANLTGDLLELPAGALGFAAGYEYRRDNVVNLPDPFVVAGVSSTNQANPTSGGYSLNEFYLEFSVPLLKDAPLAQTLELSLAGRYSDYSNFGDTTNGKFGFRWKPIDDLLVRGNYSQGYRAPSVGELFLGTRESFLTVADPCVHATGTIAANCAAQGVPSTVEQANAQIRVLQGGSIDLTPEKATTKTLGLVYSPSYVQGLDLYLDWYSINLRDTIAIVPSGFSLGQCYTTGTFCQNIVRGPDGSLDHVNSVYDNQGRYREEGYDFTVGYKFDTESFGKFNFLWDNNYISKYTQQALSGVAADGSLEFTTTSVVGNYYGGGNAYWRWKSNLTTDWQYGDWGATLITRYMSHLDEDCGFATGTTLCGTNPDFVDPQFGEQFHEVASRWYFDLQGRWDAPWNARVTAGVNNLFDKDPPIAYSALANSFDFNYPVPGRFYYVQYSQKF